MRADENQGKAMANRERKEAFDALAIHVAIQRHKDVRYEVGAIGKRHHWDPAARGIARRVVDAIRWALA